MAKNKRYPSFQGLNLSLERQYEILERRANKRLQRLEKYAQREGYGELTEYSYARAMRDIKNVRGEGHKRFNRTMPANESVARKVINDMQTFLRSATSTLKGGFGSTGVSVDKFEAMAKKFNEGLQGVGDALTWQEIANFYASYNGKKIKVLEASSSAVQKALAEFKRLNKENPNKTLEQWRNDIKANKQLTLSSNDEADAAMKLMIENNISPKNLFVKRSYKTNEKGFTEGVKNSLKRSK